MASAVASTLLNFRTLHNVALTFQDRSTKKWKQKFLSTDLPRP
jgi:hypothetical protein